MRSYGSLRRRADFARLYRRGKLAQGRHLSLYAVRDPRGDAQPLIGIAVSKAVGGAVERNRIRRRAKAIFDAIGLTERTRWRFVMVAKVGSAALTFAEFERELRGIYARTLT